MKMLQNYYFNKAGKVKCWCISLLLLIAGPLWAQAQLSDKLYLVNETSIGNVEIVEVSRRKVKVKNLDGKELAFKVREISMAFNKDGNYLTFPHSPQQLNAFLSPEEQEAEADLIVTLAGELVPARIKSENGSEINYRELAGDRNTKHISTTKLAAVIYKDGNHKLFASPSRVAEVMAPLAGQVTEARQTSDNSRKNPAVDPFGSGNAISQNRPEQEQPNREIASTHDSRLKATAEIDPAVYSRKALQKTADLGTYLAIISDRSNSMAEANKAVELAVQLFIDENAQVEVSSKDGKDRYKVRAYFNRLKLLKYDKVEISWTDISYVSDLKKGIDGNYYGVITLQQRFKGFIDNEVVYGDLTEKNIEVMLVPYQKETGGGQQQKWDVFLSDVGVVVTKFDQ